MKDFSDKGSKMQENELKGITENSTSQTTKDILATTTDERLLHVYAYNYNWDDGFEILKIILKNPVCSLSTALLMFYWCDGYYYLLHRSTSSNDTEWYAFINELYHNIINGVYKKTNIAFEQPLSKVQIHQLKKTLTEKEMILLTPIDGEQII